MEKIEEFKQFAKNKPHLADLVLAKQATWQELYETYDIYGPEHHIFQPVKENNQEETKKEPGTPLLNEGKINWNAVAQAVSTVDLQKISDGLSGLKKVIDIFGQFTGNNETPQATNKRPFRRYND